MKQAEIEYKIDEFIGLLDKNYRTSNRPNSTIEDKMGYLRICIKYQQFNLEVLQRENNYYKTFFQEKNK